LALVNVLVLLFALLLLAAIVVNQLVHDLYEQLDQELGLLAAQALKQVEIADNTPRFATDGQPLALPIGPEGFVRLLDTSGQITTGLGQYDNTPVLPQTLATPAQGQLLNQTSKNGLPLRLYTLPLLAENRVVGYLQVAAEREEIQETIDSLRRSLIIGIPVTLLVTGLLSLWTARRALRPLTAMTRSAAAISAEDLSERLPVPPIKDEVQSLALTFNATLERLAAAFNRQRRFTADASHELRTPVTAILGQAEFALSRTRSAEAYQHSLLLIQREAERMQRLIGRMLTLARIETGHQSLHMAPTDLVLLIQSLVDALSPRTEAKGLALEVNTPAQLIISTDADSLTQILLNLLENAVTYTEQGRVKLSLTSASDQVSITISNTGPGIPPEHLPHIFEPFYRVDKSRSHDQGNMGLGLALTYELTQLLGGDIKVSSQPNDDTTFTLTLPVQMS
jgi:heavy metal sensor kinase